MAINVSGCVNEAWSILKPKIEARLQMQSGQGSVTSEDKQKILAQNKEIVEACVQGILHHILANAEVPLATWATTVDSVVASAVPVPMDGGAALKIAISAGTAAPKLNKIL